MADADYPGESIAIACDLHRLDFLLKTAINGPLASVPADFMLKSLLGNRGVVATDVKVVPSITSTGRPTATVIVSADDPAANAPFYVSCDLPGTLPMLGARPPVPQGEDELPVDEGSEPTKAELARRRLEANASTLFAEIATAMTNRTPDDCDACEVELRKRLPTESAAAAMFAVQVTWAELRAASLALNLFDGFLHQHSLRIADRGNVGASAGAAYELAPRHSALAALGLQRRRLPLPLINFVAGREGLWLLANPDCSGNSSYAALACRASAVAAALKKRWGRTESAEGLLVLPEKAHVGLVAETALAFVRHLTPCPVDAVGVLALPPMPFALGHAGTRLDATPAGLRARATFSGFSMGFPESGVAELPMVVDDTSRTHPKAERESTSEKVVVIRPVRLVRQEPLPIEEAAVVGLSATTADYAPAEVLLPSECIALAAKARQQGKIVCFDIFSGATTPQLGRSLVHLAIACGADIVQVGPPCGGAQNTAVWNELFRLDTSIPVGAFEGFSQSVPPEVFSPPLVPPTLPGRK